MSSSGSCFYSLYFFVSFNCFWAWRAPNWNSPGHRPGGISHNIVVWRTTREVVISTQNPTIFRRSRNIKRSYGNVWLTSFSVEDDMFENPFMLCAAVLLVVLQTTKWWLMPPGRCPGLFQLGALQARTQLTQPNTKLTRTLEAKITV